MKDTDRWIADAAHRATLLWLAGYRLKRALEGGDARKVTKEAERLQEALR